MKRKDWLKEVADDCQFAKTVEGGAMCSEGKQVEYCNFHKCPRIEMEKKE